MSWIAEYDTQGREFPTCVHVTKTTNTMTHGVTYVPIEDGKAVRAENTKLRELVRDMWKGCPADGYYCIYHCPRYDKTSESHCKLYDRMKELGIEANE